MKHHAYVATNKGAVEKLLKDYGEVITLEYGLLSVAEARRIIEIAFRTSLAKEKAVVISATRLYHEAQNALLKLFEEPPRDTTLFLIVPSFGMLLPTLRSRVQLLEPRTPMPHADLPDFVSAFIKMNTDKRSAYIKKLASGKDEDERRENRDKAIHILQGIEMLAAEDIAKNKDLLTDIAELRSFLHDRSAPVRMILEHLSLSLPKNFGK